MAVLRWRGGVLMTAGKFILSNARKAGLGSLALALVLPGAAATAGPAAAKTEAAANSAVGKLTEAAVYAEMKRVADWQISKFNPATGEIEGYDKALHFAPGTGDRHPQGWAHAALYVGMARWARLAESRGDDRYNQWLEQMAKRGEYMFGPRLYHADDYAIGQLYLDLYRRDRDPAKIEPLRNLFKIIAHNPRNGSMKFDQNCQDRWCWADAIFMGPPVWIELAEATSDKRYLDYADREFWATVDTLWDKDDHLFYRDTTFYDKREPNGQKVIWARGVGWVAAGLARMLEHIPKDHPRRGDYEKLFVQLMTRLAKQQQPDGLWRPSVLDPQSMPFKETSGTALMGFAFAAGINQGLLDRKTFRPVVVKAWAGLCAAIQPDGKLGWVQEIGEAPQKVNKDNTQIYAVGGFLAMGTEIETMLRSEKR